MSNNYYARRLAARLFAAKYPIPVFANRIGEMMFELGLNPVEDTHKLAEYPDKYLMSFYNVGKAAVRAIRSEFGPYIAPQQCGNPLPPNARAIAGDRPEWIDDPWYDLRPEQAWRAGWEAAKVRAAFLALERSCWASNECDSDDALERFHSEPRMEMARDIREAITAMEPPA